MVDLNDLIESTVSEHVHSLKRVDRDTKVAAATLSAAEARFLVDYYYITQDDRIRAGNQRRALEASGEPHKAILWLMEQAGLLEKSVQSILDSYSANHVSGAWMRAQTGVGPVIAAGLLAHIDIEKAHTVGQIYRYAGLDYSDEWLGRAKAEKIVSAAVPKGMVTEAHLPAICAATSREILHGPNIGEKVSRPVFTVERLKRFLGDQKINRDNVISALARRPWNAGLKTLCWKLGESFTKVQNKDNAFYGHVLAQRKQLEWQRNVGGELSDQAIESLEKKKFGKTTEAYKWYAGHFSGVEPKKDGPGLQGIPATGTTKGIQMLPPARIQLRAARYAVKLFLAHMHEARYRLELKKAPPVPYPLAILGHTDYIEPPLPHPWAD